MEKDKYLLSSLNNALQIVDLLSHHKELSLAEIQRETNFDKTSIFRMLYTLEKNNYVEKSPTGKYSLGIKFLYYENAVASRYNIINIAKPYMAGLSYYCKGSIHLGVLQGDRIITIHTEESPYGLVVTSRIGVNAPAYTTAMGRVILAYKSEIELDILCKSFTFRKYSANSVGDKKELMELLVQVRSQGYATDIDERYPGFGALAVPVFDYTGSCVAAISLIGLSQNIASIDEKVLAEIKATAANISEKMGRK